MTVQEMMVFLYNHTGKRTDLSPYTDINNEASFDILYE
jgi:hypothetical protein